MATPQIKSLEDERLPMLLGFQKVSDNRAQNTSFIERGKGIYVYDTDGREYIEATSSFYVAALGYQHEELIDAIAAQYRELPFYVSGIRRTSKTSLDLAEKLRDLLPVNDPHILFSATGSEANDFMIKMLRFQAVARGTPERRTIIGRRDSYAGGTLASASLTGGHHEEFGLPLPGFLHVSQPDYHGAREPGESQDEFSVRLAAELDAVISAQAEGSVAAFFAEPVSFSAGLTVPPSAYFPAVSAVLRKYNVALVADEVITGFGRTGNLFGCETFDVQADHCVTAKGITSGYFPLSVLGLGRALYDDLERGSEKIGTLAHAATYAAHPVGAAAALKTIEIIERDGLVKHAARMGEHLAKRLRALADHPLVGDVRSIGLAGALDFLRRDDGDVPINDDAEAISGRVYENMMNAGVVVRHTGRSILIAPPLITTASEIDEICDRLVRALDASIVRG
jgi:4-aminobutyrate--pyruvate transaminase